VDQVVLQVAHVRRILPHIADPNQVCMPGLRLFHTLVCQLVVCLRRQHEEQEADGWAVSAAMCMAITQMLVCQPVVLLTVAP
jgi:hypothetical protein